MNFKKIKMLSIVIAIGMVMTFSVIPTVNAWPYPTGAERSVMFFDSLGYSSGILLRVEGTHCSIGEPEFFYRSARHYVTVTVANGMYFTNVQVNYLTEDYDVDQNKGTISVATNFNYLRSSIRTVAIRTTISFDVHVKEYTWYWWVGWVHTGWNDVHHEFFLDLPTDGYYPFPNVRKLYY